MSRYTCLRLVGSDVPPHPKASGKIEPKTLDGSMTVVCRHASRDARRCYGQRPGNGGGARSRAKPAAKWTHTHIHTFTLPKYTHTINIDVSHEDDKIWFTVSSKRANLSLNTPPVHLALLPAQCGVVLRVSVVRGE